MMRMKQTNKFMRKQLIHLLRKLQRMTISNRMKNRKSRKIKINLRIQKRNRRNQKNSKNR
jgi:hypothetical protein